MICGTDRRRALAVEGEPGIGKTRLLSELRRQAEERGYLVLAGSAAEFERDLPFGVWVDALDAYVASQDLDAREDLDAELLDDLAGVLPSLKRDGAATAGGLADERHRAHRAVRALLDLIATRKPLVVVLDDLHWSDAASIEVLAALLRRRTAGRVLLALGYRSGKAPAKLGAALAAPAVTIIDLGPLSEADCCAAGRRAPRRGAARRDLRAERRQPVLHAAAGAGLGAAVAQLDRRSPGAGRRRSAHGRGGAGRGARDAERRRAPALDAPRRSPAIRSSPSSRTRSPNCRRRPGSRRSTSCSTRACCTPTDVPRRFAFRHPLVRRAVYETSKGGWRLTAHARAAQALAAQGASAAARAHHVEQSGVRGERAAIELLLRGGRRRRAPGRPPARRAGTRPRCG